MQSIPCRRANQQTSAVFYTWQRFAQQQRRNERLASQRFHHIRQDLLAGVLLLWRQHVVAKQRGKAIIARCKQGHTRQLLQQGLQAFQVVTQVRKARADMVQGMLSQAQVWKPGMKYCMEILVRVRKERKEKKRLHLLALN